MFTYCFTKKFGAEFYIFGQSGKHARNGLFFQLIRKSKLSGKIFQKILLCGPIPPYLFFDA